MDEQRLVMAKQRRIVIGRKEENITEKERKEIKKINAQARWKTVGRKEMNGGIWSNQEVLKMETSYLSNLRMLIIHLQPMKGAGETQRSGKMRKKKERKGMIHPH